jgi:cysteine desulfuration protein SufE
MSDPTPDIQALIEEFSLLEDWEERYRHVIALGNAMPLFPAEARTEANKVRGCASQVWLIANPPKNRSGGSPPELTLELTFQADSDAHIVRGLAAILMRIFSGAGRTKEEILGVDAEAIFAKLGLDSHLSPQRSNGLRAMVERLRALAAAS